MQGEHEEESSIQRSSFVSSLSWHPVRKILAIGWESGEVLIWNDHDHDLFEVYSVHKSVVKVLQWSNNGSRLVSGDEVRKYINPIIFIQVTGQSIMWEVWFNFLLDQHSGS